MLLHSGATRGGSDVTVEKLSCFYIYHETHITTRSLLTGLPLEIESGLCLSAVKWKGYWINGRSEQSISKQLFVHVNLRTCVHCIHLPSVLIDEGGRGEKGFKFDFSFSFFSFFFNRKAKYKSLDEVCRGKITPQKTKMSKEIICQNLKKFTNLYVLYVSFVRGVRNMLSDETVTLKQTFVILRLRAWNNRAHYSRVKFSRNKSARQSSYKAWRSVTLKGNVRWQIFMATMQQPTIKTLILCYGRTCKNSYYLSRWCIITAVIKH